MVLAPDCFPLLCSEDDVAPEPRHEGKIRAWLTQEHVWGHSMAQPALLMILLQPAACVMPLGKFGSPFSFLFFVA